MLDKQNQEKSKDRKKRERERERETCSSVWTTAAGKVEMKRVTLSPAHRKLPSVSLL